jgi:hypothetical protein
MTVDSAQNVTATITALGVNSVGLPVAPGDVISGSVCLDTQPLGRANDVLANETRSETVNFSFDTGFPPAVTSGFPSLTSGQAVTMVDRNGATLATPVRSTTSRSRRCMPADARGSTGRVYRARHVRSRHHGRPTLHRR